MINNRQGSCFDCVHSTTIYGDPGDRETPPTEDSAECSVEFTEEQYVEFDRLDYDEIALPKVCGQFKPELIEKCYECKSEMLKPKYNWKITTSVSMKYGREKIYFCCEDCRTSFKVGFELSK